MFESLTEYVSGSPWTYVFLFVIAALDVIIPLVPSETSVILAGVLASTGDLHLVLVILFAAAGAIVGDNTAYWIGRKVGHRIVDRWFKGERRKQVGGGRACGRGHRDHPVTGLLSGSPRASRCRFRAIFSVRRCRVPAVHPAR